MRSWLGRRRRWSELSGEVRVLILLSVLLAAVVLSNRFGVLTPDTKPEMFLQPAQTARRFARAWLDTPNLGAANYNTGTGAVAGLFALFDALGLPAWLIGRVWRIGLLLIAGWGARLVVRDLIGPSLSERGLAIAGVAGAIAYVANPYVIVGGGTTPTLQPYAFLPWFVLCLLRGFRQPTWRWAVLTGLALAAMGGVNAGVGALLQLLVLLPLLAHALLVERHRVTTMLWLTARAGLVYALLSAYWLVPAIGAFGFASAIAEGTETVAAINMANSFPEVLRGLGMWTLYGQDGSGPFDPNRIAFVDNPLVILLTFGGPIIAGLGILLTRSPARVFGATSVLVASVVMVGSFAPGPQTPWGRALDFLLESVPGMLAFRTTNKAGGILELGLAVLVALAASALAERLTDVRQRMVAISVAAAVVAGGVAPALTGGLFWIPMDTPRYWFDAADRVNARGGDSRVLMVPGVGVPDYTWGYSGPDELGPSLFTRPFVFRSAALPGGDYAAALLSGVDRRLQNGTLPPGTMSVMADYLDVGDIVGRYDITTRQETLGARVEEQLSADRGLGPAEVFGRGEEGLGAAGPVVLHEVLRAETALSTNVEGIQGALIIDGSGAALPALTEAGLLDLRPPLLFSGALSDDQLKQAVAAGARLVLTDSNVRREWSVSNPTGIGPVQSADTSTRLTRALFDRDKQTTADVRGNASVVTRGSGLLFGPFEYAAVEQAFDGDMSTAWRFGNFGTGVGNAVSIVPERPMEMSSLVLHPHQGGNSWITTAQVTATVAGRSVTEDISLPVWRSVPTTVELPLGAVSKLDIEVTGVGGAGDAPVGFSEISIPEVRISKVVQVSSDLAQRARSTAESAGLDLSQVPVDVLLERERGDANGLSPGQARLEREFQLPDDRPYQVSGTFRLAAGIADQAIDSLAGGAGQVQATASSRLFYRPEARASMAADSVRGRANLTTAWSPDDPVLGEWIRFDFPRQPLASFTLTQNDGGALATRVLVSIDDGEPFEAELGAEFNWIPLPQATDASRLRILITERSGLGFVRFAHVGIPGTRTSEPETASGHENECVRIAAIDGRDIRTRIGRHRDALLRGESVPIQPCEEALELSAGQHWLGSNEDFAVDFLHLSSIDARPAPPTSVPLVVTNQAVDRIRIELPEGCDECVVSSGQSFDARWRATVNGSDLGPPTVADGFAAGWLLHDAPAGSEVVMEFGPRRQGAAAWIVSLLTFLISVGFVAVHRHVGMHRRHGGDRHD